MTTATVRPSDDDWMSAQQFAAIVGKSVETIYNERKRGEDLPPMYDFKKYLRFRKSEVDAWLMKHRNVTAGAQLAQDAPVPRPHYGFRKNQTA